MFGRAVRTCLLSWTVLCLPVLASASGGGPDEPIRFTDVAADDGAGIAYRRTPSDAEAFYRALKERTLIDADGDGIADHPLTVAEIPTVPLKSRGAPGVAVADFDLDGRLDLYVTNGPGTANSLYANTGSAEGLSFVDRAVEAGVDATDLDATGVCFGDLDNDGDPDLYVLGNSAPNRLFENLGNGTFAERPSAGAGGGARGSSSCSMGDVDGDGRLDIAVANAFDMAQQFAIFVEPFALNQHNQLFRNLGDLAFEDVSATSGVEVLAGLPPDQEGAAGITWAIALVDLDLDGDVDLVAAEDQAAILPAYAGGVDRGYIRWFENDGTGHFTDRTVEAGLDRWGAWMGLAFADFDHDGTLDIFGSNLGDFMWQILPPPFTLGDQSSRWLLGRQDGTFADPGVGVLGATPFGWGVVATDYDADGDPDVIYHGGLDFTPGIDASNPGAVLRNDGAASFTRDTGALVGSTDHQRRIVGGVAAGDLDGDGFVDLVSVSNEDAGAGVPLLPYPATPGPFGGDATFVGMFEPVGPDAFVWSGLELDDGTLSVEVSSGNRNHRIVVDLLGTVGLVAGAGVNRDGIGAVVQVTPRGGRRALQPVLGGASHASQDSLSAHFGLGRAPFATVEVLWPGGVRNRLYRVRDGERVVVPEIPCSIDTGESFLRYRRCVRSSLRTLRQAGLITARERARLWWSALVAYHDR